MNQVRPAEFKDDSAYATFLNELKHAAICCKVVEETSWNDSHGEVMKRARIEGADKVTAVSKLSGPGCRQQMMVFEAKELGSDGTTYIVAFRAGNASGCKEPKSLAEGGSCSAHEQLVGPEGVDRALWELAASVPLQLWLLPSLWLPGLREGRDRLIITGFSVGGAVAAVTTLQLLQLLENGEHDDVMRNQIRCFTFGAPLQGGKSYADRIDTSFQKHFYHAVYQGDPIPGMLTLIKKAAKDDRLSRDSRPLYISVLAGICALTGIAAGIAAAVVAPAAGVSLILPFLSSALNAPTTLDKLAADLKKLMIQQAESRTPLPEYEFCGMLLLLIKEVDRDIKFVPHCGNSEFRAKVFRVVPDNVSVHLLQNPEHTIPIPSLVWYLQIVKGVHNKYRTSSASSSRSAAPNADVAQPSGCFALRPGRSHEFDGRNDMWLLEPRLRRDNPVFVFLDQNGRNITVKVYGENIVFGIHVLYLDKYGVEKLRLPCTGYPWWSLVDATLPYNSKPNLSFESSGLEFSAHLRDINDSFTDGSLKVELAFGSFEIPASQLSKSFRKLNPMKEIQVAYRYAFLPPQELVELLITLAKANAVAMCHTAFSLIQGNRPESREIVKETAKKFYESPSPECKLLDSFLYLMGADTLNGSDGEALPMEMQKVLGNREKDKLITPLFPEAAEALTFSNSFRWAVQPMLSEKMLSSEKTAQKLREELDKVLEFPRMVLKKWLNSELKVTNYKKAFSFQNQKNWKKEKNVLAEGRKATAILSASAPLVSIPFLLTAHFGPENHPNVKKIAKWVGGVIGAPTALVGVGIFYSAWFLVHVASKPMRMYNNEPGLVDDYKRSQACLDDWNTKLQAACWLFELPANECAGLPCDLEFYLYNKLQGTRAGGEGCFNTKDMNLPFENTRHTLLDTLRVANFGYAARWMHEVRRYLTELQTSVGLIGPVQAGKSSFAHLAFEVKNLCTTGIKGRTRVISRFPGISAKPGFGVNRQFTVIDFPGSTDAVAQDLYISGLSLASVLVVFMIMTDLTTTSGLDLILEVCKARRKDETISALFCFTHADETYEKYKDEVVGMDDPTPSSLQTVRQRFEDNWMMYKDNLGKSLDKKGCIGDDWKYVHDNMHACNFRSILQEETLPSQDRSRKQEDLLTLALELKQMGIKDVAWVRNWCYQSLARIS